MATLPFLPQHPVVALRRAVLAHGYQPVAVYSKRKNPQGNDWQFTSGLPVFDGAALNTGIICNSLRAVDIDNDDPSMAATAVALAEEIIGQTPLVRFRANSCRRLLLYRSIPRNGRSQICKVEIRGKDQQFVAFGKHPTGAELEWEGESPADFAWAELPEALPDAEDRFVKALREELGGGNEPEPTATVVPIASDRPIFRQANDAALANLSAWVPAIFPGAKHQGGTGAYRVSSKQLRRDLQEDLSLAPSGIIDFGVADMGDARQGRRTAIDVVMEWGAAADAVAACRWLCDRLGLAFESREPVPAAVVEAAAGMVAKARPASPKDPLDAITLGKGVDWTHPAGLLGTMADWIMATSRRPNRPLAVAAATAVLSTVCGRHLYGPTGTGLNLYIICLAETTVGKDRPLSTVSQILRAADLRLHTGGDVFSVGAVEKKLLDKPCCIMTTDEIGDSLFKQILNKRASSGESKIKPVLMQLWSRDINKGPYVTIGRSQGGGDVEIECPSLSILGASTPRAFYDSLTGAGKSDGFMNRLLIATGARRVHDAEPELDGSEVPNSIKHALMGVVPNLDGNMGKALDVFSPFIDLSALKRKIPWASHNVALVASEFSNSIDTAMESNPEEQELMGRIFEYTIRLAGLHAVSRAVAKETIDNETGEITFSTAGAAVDMSDMRWGAAWAVESARVMIDRADSMMASNEFGAEFNKAKEFIMRSGSVTHREFVRKMQRVDPSIRKKILENLTESHMIKINDPNTVKRGPKQLTYEWVK